MVQLPHLQKVHGALSVQQRKQFPLPSENSPQEQGRIAHRSLHARLPAQLRQDQECHPPLHASGAYSAALYPRLPGDEEGAARGAESAVAGRGVGLPPQSTQAAPREAQAARDCDDGRPEPAGPALQGDHDQAGLQVGAHGRQGRGHRGQAAGQEGVGQRQRGGRDPQVPAAWGREKGPDGAHVQKDFYKRQSAAPLTSKAGKHVRSFNEADAFDMLMGRNIDRIYSSISGVSAGESVQDLLVRDAQDPLGSQVRQKRPSKEAFPRVLHLLPARGPQCVAGRHPRGPREAAARGAVLVKLTYLDRLLCTLCFILSTKQREERGCRENHSSALMNALQFIQNKY
mmetsp:Transcript_27714/g.39344  ORF Transcript_27714/g.39344 Transcript_27714/m.39344 type:complete len:343 (+) Transcript_27714:807-1835(+)